VPSKASPSDWGYYVSHDMGLMLISVDCILCLKAGKCADEGPTINEPYHLMASLPTLWLTEKAPAKCHRQAEYTCEIIREMNDSQMYCSLIIIADSKLKGLLDTLSLISFHFLKQKYFGHS